MSNLVGALLLTFLALAAVAGCGATLKAAPPYEVIAATIETAYAVQTRQRLLALPKGEARREELASQRARWAPVWPAWRAVVDAHDAAVISGADVDPVALVRVWCDLVSVYSLVAPEAPTLPVLVPCEVP